MPHRDLSRNATTHRTSESRRKRWLASTCVTFVATGVTLVAACSDGSPPGLNDNNGGGKIDGSGIGCGAPNDGCPCSNEGQQLECGHVKTQSGNYVTCEMGKRTCSGGHWSTCVGDHTVFKSIGSITNGVGGGVHAADYGTPTACQADAGGDPCDPACTTIPDDSTGVDGGPLLAPIDGGWTLAETAPPPDAGSTGCVGIQCNVLGNCEAGKGPKIVGKVYDPASLNPIFNAIVMIPNGAVPAIPPGVSNDPCGGATLPPAVSYAYSTYDGSFTLTQVPIGASVPILIQVGRWRRLVNINTSALTCGSTLDISTACGSNNLACNTRLPRVQSEGNIPQIALASASLDPMECLLYRIGVDSTEFTDELGTGRIHVYADGSHQAAGALLPTAANHNINNLMGFNCPYSTSWGACAEDTRNILNFGFDLGNTSGWTTSGSYAAVSSVIRWTGSYIGMVGTYFGVYSGHNTMSQTFTAPSGVTDLNSFVYSYCFVNGNYSQVTLTDNNTATTSTWSGCFNGWAAVDFANIVPGHSYTMTVISHDVNNSGAQNATFLDGVYWSTNPTPTPANKLNDYDLVMLPCVGGNEYGSANWGANANEQGRVNLVNYANVGGRIMTSHWGREWIERAGPTLTTGPFPGVATWHTDGSPPYGGGSDPLVGWIDTSFTRGNDFSQWMNITNGSGTSFNISPSRFDLSATSALSKRFVYAWSDNTGPAGHGSVPDTVSDFTFDTPLNGTAVGRTMFTNMHLASGTPANIFPGNCPAQGTALTGQEKAAEFLLFDLSGCVTQQPPILNPPPRWFDPATISRVYNPSCAPGKHVVWRFFYWEDQMPAVPDGGTGASIVFKVRTAATQAGLAGATVATLATVTTTNLSWVGSDVGAALQTIPQKSLDFLQVDMTLNPTSDHQAAPTLLGWQLTYDCVDAE